MLGSHRSGGGDLYNRFIGKLNYIGHQLLTLGPKSDHSIGFTLTKGDTAQLCQVLGVTKDELMERYKGQVVIYNDLEGNPKAWINFILYEPGDNDG